MSLARPAMRSHHYHGGAKGKVVAPVVHPAPAWRARNLPAEARDAGSKVLFSHLPADVSDVEIVDLMKKTVGPIDLKDSFMVHNSKGFPLGMAVVAFIRGTDASKARRLYNGKVIDGKRAIKLEIIIDKDDSPSQPSTFGVPSGPKAQQQKRKSLFERLGPSSSIPVQNGHPPTKTQQATPNNAAKYPSSTASGQKRQASLLERTALKAPSAPIPAPVQKRRKKGPKRVRKSVADLDREMDEYAAGGMNGDSSFMQTP